ncbi:monocarboxylate transporter 9-like [Pecten maximus]|uniref:monocarboxylate transporter 9-like n=1 Tax=Pecten maximus TaxID=6579 RepID=UPI001458CE49|nr:monocarboxylate transporter 9-like [Pecten maximus]XP_033758658.1 monocarboxylate transporter 9-like [Pecten maximus]
MENDKEKASCKADDSGVSGMSSSVSGSGSLPEEDVLAPDGGWGWVVCFGSFVTNFVLDGTMFSFGVLLIDLLDFFGETKSKTSWVGSALVGMSMMMGPFVSLLLRRHSIRAVTIMGSIVASFGFIISIFSPNIELLIITYGVIGGIGFCMMFIPAIIVVGLYFDKKRALATGIATSGSGLGTFGYAYLTDALLSTYGWRGTILILAGIVLNVVVCGLIFRPLLRRKGNGHFQKGDCCSYKAPSSELSDYPEVTESLLNRKYTFDSNEFVKSGTEKNDYIICNVPLGLHKLDRLDISKSYDVIIPKDRISDRKSRKFSSVVDLKEEYCDVSSSMPPSQIINQRLLKPMMKKDIFYSGSIQNISEVQSARDLKSAIVALTKDDNESRSQRPCLGIDINDIFCFELLKDPTFLLLTICMTTWTAQIVSLTYLPDMALSKGLPRNQCAFLISLVGITNIVGRLVCGFITDCLHVKSIHIYACALFVAAAINFLLPFCDSFYLFAICAGIFGFCMASSVSLRTIVLADHLGIDKLTRSFGLIALFQGIGFIINPPLAGFLFDKTQSYVFPFALTGCMYLVSGGVCVPLLRKRKSTSGEIDIEVTAPDSSDESVID